MMLIPTPFMAFSFLEKPIPSSAMLKLIALALALSRMSILRALPFVLANLNDLLFESLSVFEQRDARVRSALLFAHGDTGDAYEEEKRKTDGEFPCLNRAAGIRIAHYKIGPRPKNACQTGDDEDAFVIAKPNRKNDWGGVEKDERNLMPCHQVQPTDGEQQRQSLDEGKR